MPIGVHMTVQYNDQFTASGPALPCDRPLHSKVCECRRVACAAGPAARCGAGLVCLGGHCRRPADGGSCGAHADCEEPWALCESGRCRAELLDLADTTGRTRRGRFNRRPSAPPERHRCELLHRDVLVPADPLTDTLEVQRLVLALPAGAVAEGPPAHVKVKAPDADGQWNRVRAYSIMLDGSAPAPHFNLTVKVYPGGPPHSRGCKGFDIVLGHL